MPGKVKTITPLLEEGSTFHVVHERTCLGQQIRARNQESAKPLTSPVLPAREILSESVPQLPPSKSFKSTLASPAPLVGAQNVLFPAHWCVCVYVHCLIHKAHRICRKKTIECGEPGELWAKLLSQARHQKNFGTKLLSQGRHLGGLTGTRKLSTDDTGQ